MISCLQGKIILKKEKFIILNVNNIGYRIFLSKKTLNAIPKEGEIIKIFSFLYVRENVLDLYGFLNWEERELFEFLISISGVGPKAALEISALGPLDKLKQSIKQGNETIFEGILGIGGKKAKKILLELSGKIREDESLEKKQEKAIEDPAFEALVNLGFPKTAVKDALSKIPKNVEGLENRVKEALKIIGH
ncbi:MAG: Holliday junction branch migration protein RuvA [Minisyncoccales bacterium]